MHGSPDHVNSVFAYGDKSFSLEGGWVEPAGWKFYMGYRFMFDKAIVEYDGRLKPSMTVYTDAGTEHPEPDAAFRAEKDNGGNISHLAAYYNELRYFLECVRDGKTPQVATLEEGAKTVELVFRELAAFVRR
jgi:predicted dehydrogenase